MATFFFSTKDTDHRPHLYLAQPIFSLRPSVSATALSWRFLFLFVEVQARDNSEKQEASAVLFPSWSPAAKGKTTEKDQRAGLCRYFVQLETVQLNAALLPASGRRSACHRGPKGHHAASAIGLAQHPHTAATSAPRGKQPGAARFCCQMLLHPLQEKINVFSQSHGRGLSIHQTWIPAAQARNPGGPRAWP